MLTTTAFDFPGYEIRAVQGEIFGITVRARNIGAGCIATVRSLGGGEIPRRSRGAGPLTARRGTCVRRAGRWVPTGHGTQPSPRRPARTCPDDLTKAEASKRIDELREATGRGG